MAETAVTPGALLAIRMAISATVQKTSRATRLEGSSLVPTRARVRLTPPRSRASSKCSRSSRASVPFSRSLAMTRPINRIRMAPNRLGRKATMPAHITWERSAKSIPCSFPGSCRSSGGSSDRKARGAVPARNLPEGGSSPARPRHVAVRPDLAGLDEVRVVRLPEVEDPRRQPRQGQGGDGGGDRDQRLDGGDVAHGLEADAAEDH